MRLAARASLVAMLALAPAMVAAQGTPATLTAEFDRMATTWNANDLDGHVAAYADSAYFMVPSGPMIGRTRIRESLSRSFWRDGKPLQQLRFEQVTVREVGRDAAIVTGRFILSGGGRADASGWFSTVWERKDGRWRIVHDHSG